MLKPVIITKVQPCEKPQFSKINMVTADRDGQEIKWETSAGADSVHVAVFNVDTFQLMFVKQVRIPVLLNDPATKGEVIECCAGLVDKDKTIDQIAIEEVEEEMGYRVKPEYLTYFRAFKNSVGKTGVNTHLYLAQVSEDDKVSEGGGLESEDIEVVSIDLADIGKFIAEDVTDVMTVTLTLLVVNLLAQSGKFK